MLPFPEAAGLADEVRRLFEDLDQQQDPSTRGLAGVYAPPMDVIERHDRIDIVVDAAGVTADNVRVLFKDGTLVIAGCKWPAVHPGGRHTAYHLVERGFGRFARAVHITAAVDVAACRATMRQGELTLSLPKINGGRETIIPVEKVL
jgi:HSP20 family protein